MSTEEKKEGPTSSLVCGGSERAVERGGRRTELNVDTGEYQVKSQLEIICSEIEESLGKYNENDSWQEIDGALFSICEGLDNNTAGKLLLKIVAVDRLYNSNLIRYLPRPEDGEGDVRPAKYEDLARTLLSLNLDGRFKKMRSKGSRFCVTTIEDVIKMHEDLTTIVFNTIGKSGDVFASKLLHFCRRDFFPILDRYAEKKAIYIMDLKVGDNVPVIDNRFRFDEVTTRYGKFCYAIFALQSSLAQNGYGQYSLSELDRYLYGYRK